ncbi:MAG TPA: SDR family oxidoreductase [Candidatus Acidoferrales bacterium]|nr:SDR family oxidoreductase [Candidatus Acidoferrales bacterium]
MKRSGELRVFDGGIAIVTGGGSGIGKALGEALAERGCEVVLADLEGGLAEQAAAAIRARGFKATAACVDVTDFRAVGGLVDETANRCGRLDYMFNNAGISISGEVLAHSIEDWNRILDVNLKGVINGVQAAYPLFVRQGFGHLVNTASMRGLMPVPFSVSYGATKAAVVSISKSLRAEGASAGVRVSVLCPGVVRTPMLRGGRWVLQPQLEAMQLRNWERFRPMDPARFARKALRQIARNKPIIVIPWWWKAPWWLDRISPRLSILLAQKLFEALKRSSIEQ